MGCRERPCPSWLRVVSPAHREVLLAFFHGVMVEPFKSFPWLLKEKPNSLPWPHLARLPHLEPFPLSQHPSCAAPFSALTLPTFPHLRTFARALASTWKVLTSYSCNDCLLLILHLLA